MAFNGALVLNSGYLGYLRVVGGLGKLSFRPEALLAMFRLNPRSGLILQDLE